jgi:putative membrane protein
VDARTEDPLPDFRQQLASDRTQLAWLRTAISLAGLGFVVAHFGLFLRHLEGVTKAQSNPASHATRVVLIGRDTGIALIGLSAVLVIVDIAQYQFARVLARHRELSPGPR